MCPYMTVHTSTKRCLVEQKRRVFICMTEKGTHRWFAVIKSIPGGGLESSGQHQTAEATSLTATSWLQQQMAVMFHCGSTFPLSLKSLPKNMARMLSHAYVHTFKPQAQASLLLNLPTKICTATLQWHSKQYRQKLRLNKHMLCTGAVHTYS